MDEKGAPVPKRREVFRLRLAPVRKGDVGRAVAGVGVLGVDAAPDVGRGALEPKLGVGLERVAQALVRHVLPAGRNAAVHLLGGIRILEAAQAELDARIDGLAASNQLSRMVGENGAPADLSPIEAMLQRLADKIDEAGAPGASHDSFEALEQQISGIAARLDEAAATRSAESGIERTLQDLVVHLRSMREETAAEIEEPPVDGVYIEPYPYPYPYPYP